MKIEAILCFIFSKSWWFTPYNDHKAQFNHNSVVFLILFHEIDQFQWFVVSSFLLQYVVIYPIKWLWMNQAHSHSNDIIKLAEVLVELDEKPKFRISFSNHFFVQMDRHWTLTVTEFDYVNSLSAYIFGRQQFNFYII